MAQEITQQTFFDHSTSSKIYDAAKIPLEYFLADTLMRADMTRIQWSSDAYAFRRRFEIADAQKGEFDSLQPTSLNFPFINYWYENGTFWEPDDRPFATNSQQMLHGFWAPGLPARMRVIAVKTPMIATAYYNREDDARLAYEMFMWERQPKGPVQLATSVSWKGVDIAIPVFVTVESANFNPQFNETDWLKSQRIFPIQIKMTIRTYILGFPHQTPLAPSLLDTRPQPPYNIGRYTWGTVGDSDDTVSITEQVILQFASDKQWGDLTVQDTVSLDSIDTSTYAATNIALDAKDGVDEALYTQETVNNKVLDIITGYFSSEEEIYLNSCEIPQDTITTTSCTLQWSIRRPELAYFKDITILTPGQPEIVIVDPIITSQVISGLYPNSEYSITVLFHSTNGTTKDIHLTITTASDPSNPVPFSRRRGKLRGMTW